MIERSDSIILGILGNLDHFRHFFLLLIIFHLFMMNWCSIPSWSRKCYFLPNPIMKISRLALRLLRGLNIFCFLKAVLTISVNLWKSGP